MGKFYWLKLGRNFFKRHDMLILDSMNLDGKQYELFFVKLMVESIDHDGALRFSDEIPYTEDMLATITNTDKGVARDAMKVFLKFGLVVLLEDGTFFIPLVRGLIGSAEDNDNANRQRRYRERVASASVTENNGERYGDVTKCNGERYASVTETLQNVTHSVTKNNESKSKSKSKIQSKSKIKEKEKERENERTSSLAALSEKKSRFVPPTVEEVKAYCEERKNGINPETFVDFYSSKNWMVGKTKMVDWKACVRTWEKRERDMIQAPGKKELEIMENDYGNKEDFPVFDADPLADLDKILGDMNNE